MITRILFFLLVAVLFSTILWNAKALANYMDALSLASDASAVVFKNSPSSDSLIRVNKPTFMQLEKENQAALTSQVRIGYFLLRGF
jgi:hypothetical protein